MIHPVRLLCALVFISSTVQARPLIVGYIDYPPYATTTRTETGYISGGLAIETSRATITEIGREVEFVRMPIKRLLHSLYSGEVDILHLLMNYPLDRKRAHFSNAPLFITRLNAYSLPGQAAIDSVLDLRGQSVITTLGFTYGNIRELINHPDSGIEVLNAKSYEAGFLMLKNERAPYLLSYEGAAKQTISQLKITDLQQHTLMATPVTWVVSGATPNAKQLVLQLNRAYQRLAEEGRLPRQTKPPNHAPQPHKNRKLLPRLRVK